MKNFQQYYVLITLFMIQIPSNFGLNILGLFPHPGASHFLFFKPLLLELNQQGHNLTIISYFPNEKPITNYTDLEIHGLPALKDFIDLKLFDNGNIQNVFESYWMIHEWGLKSCEIAFQSKAIATILKLHTKFDIILVEKFNNDGILAIAHLMNAPVIALSSCSLLPWHYLHMNTPFLSSYMPVIFTDFNQNMNFLTRLRNWFYYYTINLMYKYITQYQTNQLIQKYFGDLNIPDVNDLTRKTSVMLINQHYSLTGVLPFTPNIIEIGGLQIGESKPINSEIKKILDSAANGVIYINWGSMIRAETLPVVKRDAILKAMSQLEQIVIWKWENETLPNRPQNVHIFKWMAQRDILCHPNVKVFMSHGGLLGSSEAAYCGVPVIVTPIFGDQYANAAAMEYRGIGTILNYNEINEDNILQAIQNALSLKSVQKTKLVSDSFKNRPIDPMSTAIWWVKHVAETKGADLVRPTTQQIPWLIYYSYDIYGFLIVIIFIILMLFVLLTKLTFKLISYLFVVDNNKQQKLKRN